MNDLTTDVARVRSVLLRELETVNTYEELARQSSSEEIKAFFLHLALEEKEHVAEATLLLRKMDPDQEKHFQKDYSQAHFQGAPHPVSPPAPPAAPPVAAPSLSENLRIPPDPSRMAYALPAPPGHFAGNFTVGPLKRRDR